MLFCFLFVCLFVCLFSYLIKSYGCPVDQTCNGHFCFGDFIFFKHEKLQMDARGPTDKYSVEFIITFFYFHHHKSIMVLALTIRFYWHLLDKCLELSPPFSNLNKTILYIDVFRHSNDDILYICNNRQKTRGSFFIWWKDVDGVTNGWHSILYH